MGAQGTKSPQMIPRPLSPKTLPPRIQWTPRLKQQFAAAFFALGQGGKLCTKSARRFAVFWRPKLILFILFFYLATPKKVMEHMIHNCGVPAHMLTRQKVASYLQVR